MRRDPEAGEHVVDVVVVDRDLGRGARQFDRTGRRLYQAGIEQERAVEPDQRDLAGDRDLVAVYLDQRAPDRHGQQLTLERAFEVRGREQFVHACRPAPDRCRGQ